MIKQQKYLDPIAALRAKMIAEGKGDSPFGDLGRQTEEHLRFYEKELPTILENQVKYILDFIIPKLKPVDRFIVLVSRRAWFFKKKWRIRLLDWWLKGRVELIRFEGINEPFFTFEKAIIYGCTYRLDLPLWHSNTIPLKDKVEDLEVENGRYVKRDPNVPL